MADIDKFRVVKVSGLDSGRAAVETFDPAVESPPGLASAWQILGVTMTASSGAEDVAIMSHGYARGLASGDLDGWEPSAGALLWCGSAGKPTTTRPTTGPQILVGTYLGSGVCDVNVRVLPSLGELSFVTRQAPVDLDVLIWDSITGQWVPRQLVHGTDLADLDQDDHPQYTMRRWAWFMGDF